MTKKSDKALALSREHMPVDYSVSLQKYTRGRSVRIPDDYGPEQSLHGFDVEYRNVIDYIVRITHRIWESDARDVDYIADCYSSDCIVFDDYGLQRGNKKIIADTYHTTGAFPDIILDAEEVVWAGDDQIGLHTSHRTRILGTNTAPSRYGEANGASVNLLVIANCVALENDIFLEHVLYNTSAMLLQLGKDLWQEAERLAADPPPGWPRTKAVWDQLRSEVRPAQPLSVIEPVDGFDPDAFSRRVHETVWSGDVQAIVDHYQTGFAFEGTSNRSFNGSDAYANYILQLRMAFPDMDFQVDEVYWMGNETDGWLISTRWSLEATHKADGYYGPATGAQCQIWGITQWQVKDQIISQEWQLFNEFDLMMQIARARAHAN